MPRPKPEKEIHYTTIALTKETHEIVRRKAFDRGMSVLQYATKKLLLNNDEKVFKKK